MIFSIEVMIINKELLPLGSIVLLNDDKNKLMVTGYLVSTNDYPNHVFDYCVCMYPEGIIRSDTICVFNHLEINKIIFKGYMDNEEKYYLEKVKNTIGKISLIKK